MLEVYNDGTPNGLKISICLEELGAPIRGFIASPSAASRRRTACIADALDGSLRGDPERGRSLRPVPHFASDASKMVRPLQAFGTERSRGHEPKTRFVSFGHLVSAAAVNGVLSLEKRVAN
jgi:hypothetical protein